MKVTIYGKPMCSACNTAKETLTAWNKAAEAAGEPLLDWEYKELAKDYTIVEFYNVAPRSHRTFPMIALDGQYVGTFADLREKLNK